MIKIRLFVGIS